jgi:DnaJ-class molecular chaperone
MSEQKKTCNTCGGSGEIGFFQGESRFFITREECPACCGFGYVLEEENPNDPIGSPATENDGAGEGDE